MNEKSLCKTCVYFNHFRLNLFKKDKRFPRVRFVKCSMAPASDIPKVECDYYRKKKLKHRLGMAP